MYYYMNNIVACYNNDGTETTLDKCDYVQLQLLGSHSNNNSNALVSKKSLNTVLQYKWYLGKDDYPTTYGGTKPIRRCKVKMHQLLFAYSDIEKGNVIDHINRNKLDNRMENLRICTAKENSYNRTKPKNSANKFKGVVKQKNGLFTAKITKDGKVHAIKDITDEKTAATTHDMMAEELFGIYAGKNFTQ